MESFTSLLMAVGTEALKTWGVYATLLIGLGLIIWHLRSENRDLRKKLDEVQETRLKEAQELIKVTERSTETQIARTQGDQAFAQLLIQVATMAAKGAPDPAMGRHLIDPPMAFTPVPATPRDGA